LTNPLFLAYDSRFATMPFPVGSPDGPQYYSYETGPLHVLMLNGFGFYTAGTPQFTWLTADLAAIDRSVTPWVIAITHAPWYNSNKDHQGDGDGMKAAMESLFVAAKVAFVASGHVHAYERFLPTVGGEATPGGPMYVTIGDGGNREGLYNNWLVQPANSAFRAAEYGHGRLDFLNSTTARWSWHRDADAEPVVSDSYVLTNPYTA
jgi:hypothetical protein